MTVIDDAAGTVGSQQRSPRERIMPADHWDWHIPTPFSHGWRVDNLLFVGGQLSADKDGNVLGVGDIEVQTRNVFENVTKVLSEAGATWHDVVKMNTYYCFEGSGDEVQEFWEKMTAIRLQYLPDPGPVGTAVRVAGLMYDGFLIEVDVMAVLPDRVPEPAAGL
ncbi:MAG: 2-iminobutanoate/2-iminopropanoate deaminase [Actinomycetota bacterium]|jgi:enamine deaminase RidA (YjgF/YER057c/UK114 family)|nr:2-iminobutanoate/2-iminopropanoate deaminase [Actinomycetota bacterium]